MKINPKITRKYPIIAIYLFGSQASNNVGPLSDYDFAVQLKDNVSEEEATDIQGRLSLDLSHELSGKSVDIVILNYAPILLKYQCLSRGKLLYSSDDKKRAKLTYEILQKYLDWSHFEKSFSSALIKKVSKRGLNV